MLSRVQLSHRSQKISPSEWPAASILGPDLVEYLFVMLLLIPLTHTYNQERGIESQNYFEACEDHSGGCERAEAAVSRI